MTLEASLFFEQRFQFQYLGSGPVTMRFPEGLQVTQKSLPLLSRPLFPNELGVRPHRINHGAPIDSYIVSPFNLCPNRITRLPAAFRQRFLIQKVWGSFTHPARPVEKPAPHH